MNMALTPAMGVVRIVGAEGEMEKDEVLSKIVNY